jgi:hypothetical protein
MARSPADENDADPEAGGVVVAGRLAGMVIALLPGLAGPDLKDHAECSGGGRGLRHTATLGGHEERDSGP